jgi:hypothetical protein
MKYRMKVTAMALPRIGYFRELSYGRNSDPSIKDSIRAKGLEDEDKIAGYLAHGVPGCVSPGVTFDGLNPGPPIGSLSILTDGKYSWFSDLVYYLQRYHIELPEEFVNHIRKQNYICVDEVDIDLDTV